MDSFIAPFAVVSPIASLLQTVIHHADAENRRRHEEKMAEINMIANSELRDSYVEQLILDKFLAPVEEAQHQIQNTAKYAQYMAESVNYYYRDHHLSKEQARDVCQQFRYLAVKIAQADSLYDLKLIYEAVSVFADRMSEFKHHDRKYAIERAIRKNILDKLGTCIAIENNFQCRLSLMNKNHSQQVNNNNSKILESS